MGEDAGKRSILELLREREMAAVLRAIPPASAITPRQLEQRLPGVNRSLVRRRLDALLASGVVVLQRSRAAPPVARYRLALDALNLDMLMIPSVGVEWEEDWNVGTEPHDGMWAIRTVAGQWFVPIVRALADGPLGPRELGRRIEGLSHSTLMDELADMASSQLLAREEDPDGTVRYALRDSARLISVLAVLAVSLEWRLGRPVDLAYASDLWALVHALAPLVELPPEAQGICHLHVDDCPQCREPDVYLAIDNGRLIALTAPPADPPKAAAHATAPRWCDALLLRRPRAVQQAGCQDLLRAVLGALSTLLAPKDTDIRPNQC